MTFFNTTNLQGEQLTCAFKKTEKQEARILRFFQANPNKEFTPLEIHDILGFTGPETSTRRSMTNLTTKEDLVMTKNKRIGRHGSPNHTWRLR